MEPGCQCLAAPTEVVIGSNNMLKEGSGCLADPIGAKSVADVA